MGHGSGCHAPRTIPSRIRALHCLQSAPGPSQTFCSWQGTLKRKGRAAFVLPFFGITEVCRAEAESRKGLQGLPVRCLFLGMNSDERHLLYRLIYKEYQVLSHTQWFRIETTKSETLTLKELKATKESCASCTIPGNSKTMF